MLFNASHMKTEGTRKDTNLVEFFVGFPRARVSTHHSNVLLLAQDCVPHTFRYTTAYVTKKPYKKGHRFLSIQKFLISFKLLQGFQIKRLLLLASRLSRWNHDCQINCIKLKITSAHTLAARAIDLAKVLKWIYSSGECQMKSFLTFSIISVIKSFALTNF